MTERWRPNFDQAFRENIEEFLEQHDEIPYSNPRDFVEFAVNSMIVDVNTRQKDIEKAAVKKIKDDLDLK